MLTSLPQRGWRVGHDVVPRVRFSDSDMSQTRCWIIQGPGFFCLCRLPGQVRRWSWHGSLAQVAPRHIGDFSKAMLFLARFGAEAFGQKFSEQGCTAFQYIGPFAHHEHVMLFFPSSWAPIGFASSEESLDAIWLTTPGIAAGCGRRTVQGSRQQDTYLK